MVYALRRPILWAADQPQIKKALLSTPLSRKVVSRFVAGERVSDAVDAVRRLRADGIHAAIDHLGEDVTTEYQALAGQQANLELIQALDDAGLAEGAEVTLKLSALGQGLGRSGVALARTQAGAIADEASRNGVLVSVDMEDHTTVDATLQTVESMRQGTPSVGVALQAMLRRTAEDLPRMAAAGGRVRLVKGAYDEPESVAYSGGREVDRAYARGLGRLFAGDGYPMVATHDPALISLALRLADEHRRTPDEFEFQMLYGIRSDEQKRLAAAGYRVRAYVPYGVDWYGYFTRRLAERPANLAFFLRSLVPG
ncbi:proline dehydrogenase [Epidermidibacterium keratini]|uniref:proline dehydrogenase n=1 Tax=Epidermidibacterium keratini TaxID=1891644 RepID=A0A7L4YP98_9ACTN|nr:proline dehydrogenase family protein [Epidermidibacterium keratini]QHC00723.1 proline dehydrogenase [Epidermidibacterium keratini]